MWYSSVRGEVMENEFYRSRLIDEQIQYYLRLFGAVSIEGPKWSGKTWSALHHAKSVVYIGSDEIGRAHV